MDDLSIQKRRNLSAKIVLLFAVAMFSLTAAEAAQPKQSLIISRGDLRLCMTFDEFRAGPMREFAMEIVHGNPILPGLQQLVRSEFSESLEVKVKVSVWFVEGKLGEIRVRIPPYTARPQRLPEGQKVFSSLRDEILKSYAARPLGPIFVTEQTTPQHQLLLLVDRQGNIISLEFVQADDEFVQLSYYAHGNPQGQWGNVAALLLGGSPRFCAVDKMAAR